MLGGLMNRPSADAIEKLRRRAPDFPVEPFCKAVGMYPIDMQHQKQEGRTPKGVRDDLGKISNAAEVLYRLLANGSDELRDYIGEECVLFGDPMLPERIMPELLRLSGLAQNAQTEALEEVGVGAPRSAKSRLIGRLECALREAGIQPNTRDNGALVSAFEVACEELGIAVANTADTVRKALPGLRRKQ